MSTPNPAYPITVFGKPDAQCFGCKSTKAQFAAAGLQFAYVDLTDEDNAELVATFKEQGILQAPYVVTPDQKWTGLVPDNIKAAIAAYQAATGEQEDAA